MDATRRETMLAGAAAAAAAAVGSGAATAQPARPSPKALFWVPTHTPCDRNLRFDPGAFRDMLAWYKHHGVDGVVVLGTTGEFPSFSVAERKLIAETALKDKLGLNVMVGPGTSNIAETIELSRHAQDHGADGLLVIPPFYYNNPSTDGLARYFAMLFEAVRLPINLYHIPGTSEAPIGLDLLRAMKRYPNLAGIKDSSGDAAGYQAFIAAFPELNMRTGTGSKIEAALDNGMGAIIAEGNLFPDVWMEVFKAYRAGQDYRPALVRVRAVGEAFRAGNSSSYGPMKYAQSLRMGGPQTWQRPPHPDATPEQMAMLRTAVDKLRAMA